MDSFTDSVAPLTVSPISVVDNFYPEKVLSLWADRSHEGVMVDPLEGAMAVVQTVLPFETVQPLFCKFSRGDSFRSDDHAAIVR